VKINYSVKCLLQKRNLTHIIGSIYLSFFLLEYEPLKDRTPFKNLNYPATLEGVIERTKVKGEPNQKVSVAPSQKKKLGKVVHTYHLSYDGRYEIGL
jgi:hypothetical protein